MFGFFSDADPVTNFDAVMADAERFTQFFKAMLAKGIYLLHRRSSGFVPAAHDDRDIETTLQAADEAFAELAH